MEMTISEKIKELESKGYRKHHTAYASGYVSRKTDGYLVKYDGRFGKGFKWYQPCMNSSQYCYITYYVKEGC